MAPDGRLLQVNVSPGGVPKLPVASARVTTMGVEGDRQREVTVHGGPHRAVSILGIEAIQRVAAEGNPIAPGTTGENLTTEGFDVSALPPGTRLAIGDEVILELAAPAGPCRTIRHSFRDLRFGRLSATAHPRDSRMYARVISDGIVHPGDPITLQPPMDESAQRYLVMDRLDAAERESSVALWLAAARTGYGVHVVDDGEIGISAAPELPGPVFNSALGFAHLPNLVQMALDHFRRHRVAGWVVAEAPPWEGAMSESLDGRFAGVPQDVRDAERDRGLVIRELPRDDVGTFGRVVAAAGGMPKKAASAYAALEPELALDAHQHRFVAELDGQVASVASLRTHHHVGWLRAAVVLPEFRGQGIQRALIAHRARQASRLGCDLIGAAAGDGTVSARNLVRSGLQRVGDRAAYRYDATQPSRD